MSVFLLDKQLVFCYKLHECRNNYTGEIMQKKIQTTISLDINTVAWLEQLADRCDKNRSEVVRDALDDYLPKLEKRLNQMVQAAPISEVASRG